MAPVNRLIEEEQLQIRETRICRNKRSFDRMCRQVEGTQKPSDSRDCFAEAEANMLAARDKRAEFETLLNEYEEILNRLYPRHQGLPQDLSDRLEEFREFLDEHDDWFRKMLQIAERAKLDVNTGSPDLNTAQSSPLRQRLGSDTSRRTADTQVSNWVRMNAPPTVIGPTLTPRAKTLQEIGGPIPRAAMAPMSEAGQSFVSAASGNAQPRNSAQSNTCNRSTFKLPKLELPRFDGNFAKFKPFWDRFRHSIDEDKGLAPADKLTYLVSYLDEKPRKLVENLSIVNENYAVAVKTLKERYGNQNVAVDEIQAKLYRMPPVTGATTDLSNFYSELENLLGSLESLGGDAYGSHLVGLVLSKLPRSVVLTLERGKGAATEWSVLLLREMLKSEVMIREASDRRAANIDPRTNTDTTSIRQLPRQSRTAYVRYSSGYHKPSTVSEMSSSEKPVSSRAINTTTSQYRRSGGFQNTPKACAFCGGPHPNFSCQKFKTAEERKAQVKNRCFNCLSPNHIARDCPGMRPCVHCMKVGNHCSSLCPLQFPSPEGAHVNQEGQSERSRNYPTSVWERSAQISRGANPAPIGGSNQAPQLGGYPTCSYFHEQPVLEQKVRSTQARGAPGHISESGTLADDEHTVMKTAMVSVGSTRANTTVPVRVFLDCGCSRTYISERLARKLKLQAESSKVLAINRFGGDDKMPHVIEVKTATMFVRSVYGSLSELKVSITPTIMDRMNRIAVPSNLLANIPDDIQLADNPLPYSMCVEIDFLIGNDYIDDYMTGGRIDLTPGFHLVSSKFGWIMSGRLADKQTKKLDVVAFAQIHNNGTILPDDDLIVTTNYDCAKEPSLDELWNLESIGIRDDPDSTNDENALEQFNRTVRFENGRYQVTWPWRSNADELETNYDAAYRRLRATVSRLNKTPGLIEKYDDVLNDQLSKGIIEEVPEEEIRKTVNRVHYLPHREVLTPQKTTTKLRVVYDASAKPAPHLPSLNDCLYRGLVFMTTLVTLLMRFMMSPIAIVSDIEKAFLQIGLQPQERDVTRFLWIKDRTAPVTPQNWATFRFTRVAFGMKPSPFLLGASIVHHLRSSVVEVARSIEENLYVDNVFHGAESVEEALGFYHQSKQLFRQAGMNLREFASNCKSLIDQIPPEDRATLGLLKVLGIKWHTEHDTMFVTVPESFESAKTKREVMENQNLFKVFDPLGFISPVVVRSRMLLQKICKLKLQWNEVLPDDMVKEYVDIVKCYESLRRMCWPRYLGFGVGENSRLMCFCDASAAAYAVAIYVQSAGPDGSWQSRLLFSKARVSPIKAMTIPRLELLAVLLGIRSLKFIRDELPFSGRTVLWTDSMCCLYWIKSNKVHGRFVDNRLREIRRLAGTEFRFVPTQENPADLPSRGIKAEELTGFWWKGPSWAVQDEQNWPEDPLPTKDVTAGLEHGDVHMATANVQAVAPFELKPSSYSSLWRLVRVTAWCLRFIRHARHPKRTKELKLEEDEIWEAESLWVKFAQMEAYGDLLDCIKQKKKHSLQHQLGVFVHGSGIIRCKGRLGNVEASEETRFPALLPAKHSFTRLLILNAHSASLHAGVTQTLSTVRRRFWLPKAKRTVSQLIGRCATCRRHEGKSFGRPVMPDLPSYRVTRDHPFKSVGLDYFGPLNVRDNIAGAVKVWGCLITCLVTRAVHLDLVANLSTEDFVLCLRRFCARRGKPKLVLCDSATCFRQASKDETLSKGLDGALIRWDFITPHTPWKGGVYERMIKIVKSALKKTTGKALLTFRQLETVLLEVENIVNSRPLTHSESDPDVIPLTPNDLIGVKSLVSSDDNTTVESKESTSESLRQMAKKSSNVADQFWYLWQKDYLQGLREQQRMHHKDSKGSVQRIPTVGEVVLVNDGKLPRGKWKVAKVVEVLHSSDNLVRSVRVQFGHRKQTLLRPLTMLYPLEFDAEEKIKNTENQS